MSIEAQESRTAIRHILSQVQDTTIEIGSKRGYFISAQQLQVIEEALDSESINTPDTPEEGKTSVLPDLEANYRVQRVNLADSIKLKKIEIAGAAPQLRSDLNLELGQLLKRRAAIDKILKQIE